MTTIGDTFINLLPETLDKECDDSDELLRMLDLDPATYRTEGGRMNLLKIRAFRRSVVRELYGDVVMVRFAGMWLGIEPDGYTHS